MRYAEIFSWLGEAIFPSTPGYESEPEPEPEPESPIESKSSQFSLDMLDPASSQAIPGLAIIDTTTRREPDVFTTSRSPRLITSTHLPWNVVYPSARHRRSVYYPDSDSDYSQISLDVLEPIVHRARPPLITTATATRSEQDIFTPRSPRAPSSTRLSTRSEQGYFTPRSPGAASSTRASTGSEQDYFTPRSPRVTPPSWASWTSTPSEHYIFTPRSPRAPSPTRLSTRSEQDYFTPRSSRVTPPSWASWTSTPSEHYIFTPRSPRVTSSSRVPWDMGRHTGSIHITASNPSRRSLHVLEVLDALGEIVHREQPSLITIDISTESEHDYFTPRSPRAPSFTRQSWNVVYPSGPSSRFREEEDVHSTPTHQNPEASHTQSASIVRSVNTTDTNPSQVPFEVLDSNDRPARPLLIDTTTQNEPDISTPQSTSVPSTRLPWVAVYPSGSVHTTNITPAESSTPSDLSLEVLDPNTGRIRPPLLTLDTSVALIDQAPAPVSHPTSRGRTRW